MHVLILTIEWAWLGVWKIVHQVLVEWRQNMCEHSARYVRYWDISIVAENGFVCCVVWERCWLLRLCQDLETNRVLENIFEAFRSRLLGPVCGRKTNQWMWCSEIMVVCCQRRVEHTNTLHGQNTELLAFVPSVGAYITVTISFMFIIMGTLLIPKSQ